MFVAACGCTIYDCSEFFNALLRSAKTRGTNCLRTSATIADCIASGRFPHSLAFVQSGGRLTPPLPILAAKTKHSGCIIKFTIFCAKPNIKSNYTQITSSLFIPFNSIMFSEFVELKHSAGCPFFSYEILVPIPFATAVKTASLGIFIFEVAEI